MRFIPTRTHGMFDYVIGAILIAAPTILKLNLGSPESWVLIALGIVTITNSLMTDYEFGVVKFIPMPAHLVLDIVTGLVLVTSPWLFGFSQSAWIPHMIIGLVATIGSVTTRAQPETIHALRSGRASI